MIKKDAASQPWNPIDCISQADVFSAEIRKSLQLLFISYQMYLIFIGLMRNIVNTVRIRLLVHSVSQSNSRVLLSVFDVFLLRVLFRIFCPCVCITSAFKYKHTCEVSLLAVYNTWPTGVEPIPVHSSLRNTNTNTNTNTKKYNTWPTVMAPIPVQSSLRNVKSLRFQIVESYINESTRSKCWVSLCQLAMALNQVVLERLW